MGKPNSKEWNYKNDNSWRIEMEEFYKDIKLNRKPNPGLNEAIKNLKIIKQIYNSSKK